MQDKNYKDKIDAPYNKGYTPYGEPKFKRSLGQNFLRDKAIGREIASSISDVSLVLEIGPGDGFLTQYLLENKLNVMGVEIDPTWIEKLHRRVKKYSGFELISGSILELDWNEIAKIDGTKSIAGNLPYHLVSSIIFGIFEIVRTRSDINLVEMVIMVQDEVAKRLTAVPGNKIYGGITILSQYHAELEYLFNVPAECFFPRPKVDGAIIRFKLKSKEDLPQVDYEYFRKVVRACFGQRRKMMSNSLGQLADLPTDWKSIDFDFSLRPERLSLDQFVKLAQDLIRLSS